MLGVHQQVVLVATYKTQHVSSVTCRSSTADRPDEGTFVSTLVHSEPGGDPGRPLYNQARSEPTLMLPCIDAATELSKLCNRAHLGLVDLIKPLHGLFHPVHVKVRHLERLYFLASKERRAAVRLALRRSDRRTSSVLSDFTKQRLQVISLAPSTACSRGSMIDPMRASQSTRTSR